MKGRFDMKLPQLKKVLVGMACALSMIFSVGTMLSITSQAKSLDYQQDRDRDRDGDRDRDREREREQDRAREQDRHRYRYGNNNADVQQGYRDGSNRGREDAETHRTPNPNNSEHYRGGNRAYREGFARGYSQSFREYSHRNRR